MLTVIPVVNTRKIAKEKYTKGSEKGIEIVHLPKKKKKINWTPPEEEAILEDTKEKTGVRLPEQKSQQNGTSPSSLVNTFFFFKTRA